MSGTNCPWWFSSGWGWNLWNGDVPFSGDRWGHGGGRGQKIGKKWWRPLWTVPIAFFPVINHCFRSGWRVRQKRNIKENRTAFFTWNINLFLFSICENCNNSLTLHKYLCISQYTNKTVMRIWQLEIEKPNSSHYLLSGITRGGVFMWISVKNLKICNG